MHYIITTLFILLSSPLLYCMEHELLLKKKTAICKEKKREIQTLDDHNCPRFDSEVQKLFLLNSVIRLPKTAWHKIAHYMFDVAKHGLCFRIEKDRKTIDNLQHKIDLLTQKMNQQPYEIIVDTHKCARVLKGAGAGGCCGCMSGVCAMCSYGLVDKYVWACCNIVTPSKIVCDMMTWGFPACTLAGCIVGACCAINRCDEKIKFTIR